MLNKIKSLILLAAITLSAQAASIVVTVSFTPGVGNPTTTEHFVEQKQPDGTWKETNASGANTSILSYTTTANYGDVITVRVRSRIPGNPDSTSLPSNDAVRTIRVVAPTNARQT
jgi:flagellar basal body L-ring protein FlgH